METTKNKPIIEPKKEDKISFTLERIDGETYFSFEVAERIENIYKKQPHEVRDSKAWEGLQFYFVPTTLNSEGYKRSLTDFHLFDDYGAGLYRDDKLNIAWIRTVGGKGKIKVAEALSFAELSILVRNATQFIKDYYQENFRDFKLRGSVTIVV